MFFNSKLKKYQACNDCTNANITSLRNQYFHGFCSVFSISKQSMTCNQRRVEQEWEKKQSAVSFFFTAYFLQFNMRKWSKLMLSVLFVDVVFFLFVCIYRTIHIKTIWSASSKKQAAFVCLLFEKRAPCSQPLKFLKYLRINVFQPVNSTHYMPYIFNEWVDLTKKNQI